jgi:hypothetical protein
MTTPPDVHQARLFLLAAVPALVRQSRAEPTVQGADIVRHALRFVLNALVLIFPEHDVYEATRHACRTLELPIPEDGAKVEISATSLGLYADALAAQLFVALSDATAPERGDG